jgi:hypothetical protein
VSPARAQLDGDGQAGAEAGGACDRDRDVWVVQQGGAGAGLADLGHGAAHVEVDRVGTGRSDGLGCDAHDRGVLAKQLDRDRPTGALTGVDAQHLDTGALVAMEDGVRGEHLRDRQAGAVALGLQAHEPVADARQGGEHHTVRDRQGAELPMIREARWFGHGPIIALPAHMGDGEDVDVHPLFREALREE